MLKLNVGCGSIRLYGWINTDSSLNANFQRIPFLGKWISKFINPVLYETSNLKYMNLNRRWNYKSESVSIIYASHIFEHLTIKSEDLFLKNHIVY